MMTRTIVHVRPPRRRRQSISPEGTMLLRLQRSCSATMCRRTSRTRADIEKTTRSAMRFVSAIETFTTRQKPMNRIVSHGRSDRDSANVPTYDAVHTVAPRKSTNTVGSVAASPARTCVIQLFTFTARSRKGITSEAKAVASTIAMVPTRPPRIIERRVDIALLPTRTASTIALKRSHLHATGGNSERSDFLTQRSSASSWSASAFGSGLRSIAGRLAEEIGDRRPRGEIRAGDACDRQLAEQRVPARAVALVGGHGWSDDHGLRRDRRFTERACRPHPPAVERRCDEDARGAPPQPRQRLDQRLGDRARAARGDLGEILHELPVLLGPAVALQDFGPSAAGD